MDEYMDQMLNPNSTYTEKGQQGKKPDSPSKSANGNGIDNSNLTSFGSYPKDDDDVSKKWEKYKRKVFTTRREAFTKMSWKQAFDFLSETERQLDLMSKE